MLPTPSSSSHHLARTVLGTLLATLVACGIACSTSSPKGVEPPGDAQAGDGEAADSSIPDAGQRDSGGMDSALPDAPPDAGPNASPDAADATTEGGARDASDEGTPVEAGPFPAGALSCVQCPSGTIRRGIVCVDDTKPINGCAEPTVTSLPGAPPLANGCVLPNAVPTCAAGACAILQCDEGWADCDGLALNGCEANLALPGSCGKCGVACGSGEVCSPATGCVTTCSPPLTLVGSSCVDLTNDPVYCGGPGCFSNIGGCGSSGCSWGGGLLAACVQGTCAYSCAAGYTECGTNNCVDLANDPSNCGACGNSCVGPTGGSGGVACVAGHCEPLCPPGEQMCGSACVAEAIDPANCGACGHACTGTDVCSLGACVPLASTVVATGLTLTPTSWPTPEAADLVVDATNVYFVDSSGVHFVPKTGGAVKDIAPATGNALRVAVDDTYAYWSENLAASIMRAPKDGSGTPSLVAAASEPQGLVVTGGTVYWVSSNQTDFNIYAAPASGGSPSVLTTIKSGGCIFNSWQGPLGEIRTDGTNLFVGSSNGPIPIALPGGSSIAPAGDCYCDPSSIAARPGQYCGACGGLHSSGFSCEVGGFTVYNSPVGNWATGFVLTLPECGMAYNGGPFNSAQMWLEATYLATDFGLQAEGLSFELLPVVPVTMTSDGATVYIIDSGGNIRRIPIP